MTHPALKRNRTQGWWVLRHVQPITGIASAELVFTPATIHYGLGQYTIPDGWVDSPTLVYDQTVSPGSVPSSDDVGAAFVPLSITPGGIDSGELVTGEAGFTQLIVPVTVESDEHVDGLTSLLQNQFVTPGDIASAETVDEPIVGFQRIPNTNINRAPIFRASTR